MNIFTFISHSIGFNTWFPAPYDSWFVVFFLIGVFFGIRELTLWYWKISKRIRLLEQIEENTRKN